uniref:Putative DNA binding, helix-turn-helix domain containing protein n=1 Tax=viral metagenome TaxID=1070528 RepID=A0A6M3J0I5_9ZZZZ
MPNQKNKRGQRRQTEDRNRIARLYKEGRPQAEIADALGLTPQQVRADLVALHRLWLQTGLLDLDEARGKELVRLDRLEVEYWTGWRESQKDDQTVTEADDSQLGVKKTVRTRGQAGNPAFLQGVMECVRERCKILGLYAPERHVVSNKGADVPGNYDPKAELRIRLTQFSERTLEVSAVRQDRPDPDVPEV